MNNISKYLFTAALVLGTVVTNGCVRKSSRAGIKPETDFSTPSRKSDYVQLVRAGELLLTPNQFPLAYTIFKKAASESNGEEAQFYLKLLAPMMRLKGIFIRIKPLVGRDGNLAEFDAGIAKMPSSPAKDFFLDARRADIVSLDELQTLIEEMRDDYLDLFDFLRMNMQSNFAIDFGSWMGVGPRLRNASGADQIAMRQLVAGIALNMTIATLYNLEGGQKLLKRSATMSDRDLFESLEANRYFGLARKNRKNNLVKWMAADFAAAWKLAMDYQAELCGANEPRKNQRSGQLFEDGICVSTDMRSQQLLGVLQQALSGVVRVDFNVGSGATRTAVVDPFQFFEMQQMSTLYISSYFPNQFSACGTASGFRDPYWNGVFPYGEADVLLDPTKCRN